MRLLKDLHHLASMHHYVRACFAYRRGDNEKALEHYNRISERASRGFRHQAFHATLLILNRRSPQARTVFQQVIDEIRFEENPTENDQYVLHYCCYYVALIDQAETEQFRRAAAEISPERFVLRLLPLPPLGWLPGAESYAT